MRPKKLTVADVEFVAFSLARQLMTWDEPIPDFGSRSPNLLESCLSQPFVATREGDLYKGIIEKASILFYLMIKNHPFENGNKRIAVMTLLVFLHVNNRWLTISNKDLYEFAVGVAKSKRTSRDKAVKNIQSMLGKYLIKRST